jgi:hypothetical protein
MKNIFKLLTVAAAILFANSAMAQAHKGGNVNAAAKANVHANQHAVKATAAHDGKVTREQARANGAAQANAHANENGKNHANENSVLNATGETKVKNKDAREDEAGVKAHKPKHKEKKAKKEKKVKKEKIKEGDEG